MSSYYVGFFILIFLLLKFCFFSFLFCTFFLLWSHKTTTTTTATSISGTQKRMRRKKFLPEEPFRALRRQRGSFDRQRRPSRRPFPPLGQRRRRRHRRQRRQRPWQRDPSWPSRSLTTPMSRKWPGPRRYFRGNGRSTWLSRLKKPPSITEEVKNSQFPPPPQKNLLPKNQNWKEA